jgi:hypothetical protein
MDENRIFVNMTTFFGRGVLCMSSFLSTLKTLDKKLDLWGTSSGGSLSSCPLP